MPSSENSILRENIRLLEGVPYQQSLMTDIIFQAITGNHQIRLVSQKNVPRFPCLKGNSFFQVRPTITQVTATFIGKTWFYNILFPACILIMLIFQYLKHTVYNIRNKLWSTNNMHHLIILDSDYTLKDNFKYEGYLKLPNNKNHETYCKVICGCNISNKHIQSLFEVSVLGDCNTSYFQ